MTFDNLSYLPFIIILTVLFISMILFSEKKFFTWVKLHWFYDRSFKNKLSTYLYLLGMTLMFLALLDLRGAEQKVAGKVREQKSIILIDSSLSMQAEDVRPNRFQKAILLARHFVKKAVGHKISVIVFSDDHKQIVPFTKDINLIDAKLSGLEKLYLSRGGSGITMAIQEAIQYFKVDGSSDSLGNIIVFTDAEESSDLYDLDIPKEVSVGIVGVGTLKGSTIPLRDERGIFRGNKNFDGKDVISKLDENFLKKLTTKISNYNYWIASSYSLPTEKILSFFNKTFKEKTSNDNFRIKPVLAHYLLIPSVILIGISFVFKTFKTFHLASVLIFFFLNIKTGFTQTSPQKDEYLLKLEQKYLEGTLDKDARSHLADTLLKQGFSEQAQIVYDETLDGKINNKNKKSYFNQAVSQFKINNIQDGIDNSLKLIDYLEKSDLNEDKEMLANVKKNLLKALQITDQQKQKDKKEKEEEKKKKDIKEKEQKSGNGEQKDKDKEQNDQNQSKEDGNQKENNQKQDDQGKQDQQGKEKEIEQKDTKSKNEDNGEKDSQENNQLAKQEKNNSKGADKTINKEKVPALLKQLMSDDNKLQKEFIDAQTRKRSRSNRKDW